MKKLLGSAVAAAAGSVMLVSLAAGGASALPTSGNPPPPKGFEADSASFVTAQAGFVLGTRQCSELPCAARLARTADGGQTWSFLPALPASLVPPETTGQPTAVSTVRFSNARDGWAFNPGLWATTDGGRRWHAESLPGMVVALAASDGEVFAAAELNNGGLNKTRLYRSQVGSTTWTRVDGVIPAAALTVSGHSVWAGVAPNLATSTDGGKHWSTLPFHCPASRPDASGLAAASATDVAMACTNSGFPQPGMSQKDVFTSADGGHTFQLAGHPAEPGETGLLAMPPGQPQLITLTAVSGASFLYRSVNGGAAWHQTTYFDAGLGIRDLAYASASTGYLVHFSGGPVIAYGKGLMMTVDAGATWHNVRIP